MKAEFASTTNSFFTVDLGEIDPENYLDALAVSLRNKAAISGQTIEGAWFLIAPEQFDCVLLYEDEQVLEQHRRITLSKIRRREIEQELSPFADL